MTSSDTPASPRGHEAGAHRPGLRRHIRDIQDGQLVHRSSPTGSCRSAAARSSAAATSSKAPPDGVVENFKEPESFAVTWELGGQVSWLEVHLHECRRRHHAGVGP
jgi:hypothetical protein